MGSSPRVRGKHVPYGGKSGKIGLIPACAGKTAARPYRRAPRWAHPRVCGENSLGCCSVVPRLGSSPRVRGKPTSNSGLLPRPRLIPACAGKTGEVDCVGADRTAHPRVCGENSAHGDGWGGGGGSSPRVRGKRRGIRAQQTFQGLIPACAGKTVCDKKIRSRDGAHPRVCGENGLFIGFWGCFGGSSPRVRGKLSVSTAPNVHSGLIPACAGKTCHNPRIG